MPLTPLPADNTKRMFLIVLHGTHLHSTQIRVLDTVPESTLVTNVAFDFNLLKSQMYNDASIVGVEFAQKGSNVRNPAPGWATIFGTGPATPNAQHYARSFSMRGRSANGRKVKMLLWGIDAGEQPDWELNPGVGDFTTFVSSVQTRASMYLSIDELKPVWYSNLLEDYNDHWVKEDRP